MLHILRATPRGLSAATRIGALVIGLGGFATGLLMGQEQDPRPGGQARPDSIAKLDTIARADTVGRPARAMATRAELQDILAGKSGRVTDELQRQVKERLEKGDLQPGDRVALRVIGEQTLMDTFTVTPERTIELPSLPPVPVSGVLRSELRGYLTKQLGRYIRNPDLQAAALVRVSMMGAVGRPGFYNLPADVLVTDAIMAAGGPSTTADIDRATILRGGVPVATKEQVAAALQSGESLDQMNVQSGDEIVVGTKSQGIMGVLKVMGMISGAAFGIVAITRIF
ncbi:MAG TPA: polysaccharide biosynthesis/export family protein [Gemmatimonadales bacterium]|nr:polysaccharide biosynthesis/export family protein [Gemmatimonadales bacterium]